MFHYTKIQGISHLLLCFHNLLFTYLANKNIHAHELLTCMFVYMQLNPFLYQKMVRVKIRHLRNFCMTRRSLSFGVRSLPPVLFFRTLDVQRCFSKCFAHTCFSCPTIAQSLLLQTCVYANARQKISIQTFQFREDLRTLF